jgi:hypothetical protein
MRCQLPELFRAHPIPIDMLETVPRSGDPSRKKRAQDDVPGELPQMAVNVVIFSPRPKDQVDAAIGEFNLNERFIIATEMTGDKDGHHD